jgi:glycerol uptake facilitator-like aquaporin
MTLACTVVGSGIMATNLTNDVGVQLLINALATVFILFTLITIFAHYSGAHFNPAVTLSFLIRKNLDFQTAISYWASQIIGCGIGVLLANYMFNLPIVNLSTQTRSSTNLFLSEMIATAGLVLVIHLLVLQNKTSIIPTAVALWIGSAYFFTSSTSFANPAITIARSFSDTFAGISPDSVLMFIIFQILGTSVGLMLAYLFQSRTRSSSG